MELIIDGYNLIKQSSFFRQQEVEGLEAARMALLKYLEAYRKLRKCKIIVVFDGKKSFNLFQQREKVAGIFVIYSTWGEKADDVIKRMIIKNPKLIVVSSDREIIDFANKNRVTAIKTSEFMLRLKTALSPSVERLREKDSPSLIAPTKKGPAHRLSKHERKKAKIISNL
jgi:hypothetical protein